MLLWRSIDTLLGRGCVPSLHEIRATEFLRFFQPRSLVCGFLPLTHHYHHSRLLRLAASCMSSDHSLSLMSFVLFDRCLISNVPVIQFRRTFWSQVLTSWRHSLLNCSTDLCPAAQFRLHLRQPTSHHGWRNRTSTHLTYSHICRFPTIWFFQSCWETCRSAAPRLSHLTKLLPDLQSAYRAHHFMETAVVKVLSDIRLMMATWRCWRYWTSRLHLFILFIYLFDHGLSLLLHDELHWLDIPERVHYKLRVTVHRCLHDKAPKYLVDCISLIFLKAVAWVCYCNKVIWVWWDQSLVD